MITRRALVAGALAGVAVPALTSCQRPGGATGSTGALLRSEIDLPTPFTVPLPRPTVLRARGGAIDLAARASDVEILPGRRTRILGYDGTFPGPRIMATANEPLRVRLHNQLSIDTVLHLHGGRTPAEHDGYPTDFVRPSTERVYEYPLQQRAATLWYHDHAMDFTGPNVYAGLAGMFVLDDESEAALGLPSGDRDVPLMLCDRSFDADAQFRYPLAHPDRSHHGVESQFHGGVLGDCVLVNGAPWPVLEVDAARYRFRLLNASNARRYDLRLDEGATFVQIGTDLGLLPAPVERATVTLAGAERADVVIDFGRLAVGTTVTMTNLLDSGSAGQVMTFRVVRSASDESRVPEVLSTIESQADRVSITRDLHFSLGQHDIEHGMPLWSVNGTTFHDGDLFTARRGTVERWRLSSDVHHPVHAHLVGFQVAGPDGKQLAWKDTVDLRPGSGVEVVVPIEGYPGRYVLHCHNLEHEDMMMMVNFRVE